MTDWIFKNIFPTSIEHDQLGAAIDTAYVVVVVLIVAALVFAGLGTYVATGILGGFAILYYTGARLALWRVKKTTDGK